jgi:cytidine deaminase
MQAAQTAFLGAWAPYSRFRVGAAVLLDDGHVVIGSNQENASFPEGCCAERVALFAAGAQYPDRRPVAIAVTGETVDQAWLAPCGGCRQVMAESERRGGQAMQVILTNAAGELGILPSASLLLPWLFDGHLLEKPGK